MPKLSFIRRPEMAIGILMVAVVLGVLAYRIFGTKPGGVSVNTENTAGTATSSSPAGDQNNAADGQPAAPLPKYQGRDLREFRPDPKVVNIYTQTQLDQLKQKILDAAGSIDVNPNVLDPWLTLGLVKKDIGDYVGARDAWEYAGLIRPHNSVSFGNLGDLYWHYLPDFPRSELNFKTAVNNDPRYLDGYMGLSDLYRYSYKEKSGIADQPLLLGLEKNPNNITLTGYLARYYKETGNTAKAIEYYQKLLSLEPDNAAAIQDEINQLKAK